MFVSRTGAVIAAASEQSSRHMLKTDGITILKRIVITMQQVGIFPIVIIAGVDSDQVRDEMSGYGVIFLDTESTRPPAVTDSLELGLSCLTGKCERVMITPVSVPMVSPQTLIKMIRTEGDIVKPACQGRVGHPILLSARMAEEIRDRDWQEGLGEVLDTYRERTSLVETDDPGILMNVRNEKEMRRYLKQHNNTILRPRVELTINKEYAFFDGRAKLLLYLIDDTQNVRHACKMMGLSYSKAWNILNGLEKELGWKVVERSRGGAKGGVTRLTGRGQRFIQSYQQFEEELSLLAQNRFLEVYEEFI